jgi:hypothetical protein
MSERCFQGNLLMFSYSWTVNIRVASGLYRPTSHAHHHSVCTGSGWSSDDVITSSKNMQTLDEYKYLWVMGEKTTSATNI